MGNLFEQKELHHEIVSLGSLCSQWQWFVLLLTRSPRVCWKQLSFTRQFFVVSLSPHFFLFSGLIQKMSDRYASVSVLIPYRMQ